MARTVILAMNEAISKHLVDSIAKNGQIKVKVH